MKKCNLTRLFLAVTLLVQTLANAQNPSNKGGGVSDPIPLIIVDKVIINQQEPCTVGNLSPMGGGVINEFCIRKATGNNEQGFNNTYNGKVEKNGHTLDFTLMFGEFNPDVIDLYVGNFKHDGVPATQNPLKVLYFTYQTNSTIAECWFKKDGYPAELIFNLSGVISSTFQAKVKIKFFNDCYYGGCGNVMCNDLPIGDPGPKVPNDDGDEGPRSKEKIFQSLASPNPFSQETQINYTLEAPQSVSIQVFNAQGTLVQSLVQEQQQEAGDYTAILDGTQLANGVYFAVVQMGSTRKIHSLVKSN